jgi:transcriptional regulator with XRE-family HTH domain
VPRTQGPAGPRRRLGAELRRLREASGHRLEDVAAELGCSPSKLSRLENGRGIPKLLDVRELAEIYGPLPDAARDRLLRWAREGRHQTWWQDYADVITKANAEFDRFVALEDDAAALRSFEIEVVHGLLQVPDYTRAVVAALHPRLGTEDLDRLVQVRMRRRDLLHRSPQPLRLAVVLDESVLRRVVGGRAAMGAQLRSLLDDAELANVDLRVMPLAIGAHIGLGGSFGLIEFQGSDEADVAYLENRVSTTYLESANQVIEYAAAFDALVAQALDREESVALIASLLPGYES